MAFNTALVRSRASSLRSRRETWFSEVRDPTTGQTREISLQHPLDAEIHFSQNLPEWNLTWGVDTYFGYLVPNYLVNEIDRTYNGNNNVLYVDYRPEPSLTLRLETVLCVFGAAATDITRQVYAGPRNTSPLLFTDAQARRFGPVMFIRLRKTFD